MKVQESADQRPMWRAPELHAIGNLRDFVRTGHAYGKSGGQHDGNSMCGGEAMDVMGPCT